MHHDIIEGSNIGLHQKVSESKKLVFNAKQPKPKYTLSDVKKLDFIKGSWADDEQISDKS